MVELRGTRSSTRIKAEPGLKRRFSDALEAEADALSSAKATKIAKTQKSTSKVAAPQPSPEPTPEPKQVVLPNKLTDGIPLPVLPEPQPDDLDEKEWQSLNDSGVFAASLARSRVAIAKGAIFEKFWTKPTPTKKQKDMTEEEKLQLKAAKGPTQSKVGTVKMVCEPLTFEVQLLMIKDQHQGHRQGQLPPDKQHLIYGTPHRTATPAYTAPYRPPVQQQPTYTPAKPPAPITPVAAAPRAPAVRPPAPAPPRPPQTQPAQARTPSTAPTHAPRPSAASSRPTGSTANSQAPDPVIHALAQRASANPELKAVMKIVATGLASQQQLQYFQKHIDELTELVRQRQEQEARLRAPAQAPRPAHTSAPRPQAGAASNTPAPQMGHRPTPPATVQPAPAKPVSAQPASEQPASGHPASGHPASGQPIPAQSAPTKSASAQPASAQPASAQSESTQPTPQSVGRATPSAPAPPAQQSVNVAATSAPSHSVQQPVNQVPPAVPKPAAQQQVNQAVPLTPGSAAQQQINHAVPPTPGLPAQQSMNSAAPTVPGPPSHHSVNRAAPSTIMQPTQQAGTRPAPYTPSPRPTNNFPSTTSSSPSPALHQPRPAPSQGIIATKYTPVQNQRPQPAPVQQYHFQPSPAPPRPKMVTTATPLHILIQFSENPNERFLFPKHSILEFNHNLTEVICSFVVVKKGKDEKDYWVPVTLTFKGDAPTLSVLGRVAEPFEIAKRALEDSMLKCDRAEDGFLAFRLPREPLTLDIG